MRHLLLTGLLASIAAGTLPGCNQPRRLESNTRERLATTDGVDVDDTLRVADVLTRSLLTSPALDGSGETPVIEVSTFTNRTGEDIDRDAVLSQVRASITRSGLARMKADLSEDETASATLADRQRRAEEDAFLTGLETKQVTRNVEAVAPADYTLTMKLLENRASSDFSSEVSYRFQMTLTDTRDATVAWEDEEIVTKQRRSLGF